MKTTQKDTNPFIYSDSNKRYHTYDYYIKHKFGKKCAKIPLDCGFTCPNIDGSKGVGGCIYCSSRGSGDFAASADLSVTEQLDKTRKVMEHKWENCGIIPYFQAHTNTYAPLEVLKNKYSEALSYPDVVGVNIATRADALPDDVCEYLAEIAEKTTLTVELGLQTVHDTTAKLINRCHTTDDFIKGYRFAKDAELETRCLDFSPINQIDDFINTHRMSPEAKALLNNIKYLHQYNVLETDEEGFDSLQHK